MKNKLIIVAGCSGSGKTTICKTILESVKPGQAQIVCLDRFYLENVSALPKVKVGGHPNYDHPKAFEWKLVVKNIKDLLTNKTTNMPSYNYVIQRRNKKIDKIKPTQLIILEGTLPLINEELRQLASLKIYVDTPLDECFIRRLQRDVVDRKRSINSIVKQWKEAVRPMFVEYVETSKKYADLIIPWEKINVNGIDILTRAIKSVLK